MHKNYKHGAQPKPSRMVEYRKIKVIGKGSFGSAILVAHVSNTKKKLVMKVANFGQIDDFLGYRHLQDEPPAEGGRHQRG